MFPKVLNVLWMNQVPLPCILIVKFLKMVNLILILVVAVVPWTHSGVWELFAVIELLDPLISSDDACVVGVENLKDFDDGFVFIVRRGIFQGLVV